MIFKKLNSFLHLSLKERSLLIQALILFPLVDLCLNLKGMKYTEKFLTRLSPNIPEEKEDFNLVLKTAKIVKIASNYQFNKTCLRRSLILWYLLKKQGFNSNICIGVRKEKSNFEAHAWVEYKGFPLNEINDLKEIFTTIKN
jgi:hypothetical protein